MKKQNSTKKALICSLLSLVLCCSMLVGTTFAWFTDSVTSGNNKIVSGNLDIEVDYLAGTGDEKSWETVEGESAIFDPDAFWEPGRVEVVYFRVTNAGSLALKYSFLLNVVNYGEGINVFGEDFRLADHLRISIVEDVNGETAAFDGREAAIAAATAEGQQPRSLGSATAERVTNNKLLSGATEYFAVVIWMPEEVDNHANPKPGTIAPVVELGVHVIATQTPHEKDSFDENYDANISLDDYAIGIADFSDPNAAAAEAVAINAAGYNVASAVIDKDSVEGNVTKAILRVNKSTYVGNFTLADGATAECYDITIDGLKADNTVLVKTSLKIAAGLDENTVKIYHYNNEIACTYNPNTGWVTFETATFSPFTVVYDANSTYDSVPADLPVANVTKYVPTEPIKWESYGEWSPVEDIEANLDAIYQFSCTETVEQVDGSKYANWYCDFYVKLDQDLGENEIFLGGNYGEFGWVGFHNRDLELEANTEIGLLESVTTNPWTYLDVVQYVGSFICGVGNVGNSLEGATFTVMLRLTNPENEAEFYNVATITYKW